MKKVHYPNLNFLRFLAASIVIIHHTEQLKFIHGYSSFWNYEPVKLIGKLGVDLFFVLSGFLITSLLYVEKDVIGNIQIKKFLMRRVLRIWPLYFIVMITAFFVTPHIQLLNLGEPFISPYQHFALNSVLYILFLPHIQLYFIGPIAYCSQAWSIGIEEYFYLLWPFIVRWLKVKQILIFIISFVVAYLLLSYVCYHLMYTKFANNHLFASFTMCLSDGLKFDCLLIGGLFALVNLNLNNFSKKIVTAPVAQITLYIIELLLVFLGGWLHGYFWEIHAVIYGLIILNLVRADTSIINMEYKVFTFLGNISYGMYMYHFLVVNSIIVLVYRLKLPTLLYPLSFTGTILLSIFSYNYIEKYFLKKKIAFSNIATG